MKILDIAFQEIGQLDLARLASSLPAEGTLVVPPEADALAVARQAVAEHVGFIVVSGPPERVLGVVLPTWVSRQVSHHKRVTAESIDAALAALDADPEEVLRGFRHEWLNEARPELYWCEGGNHYTDACPCKHHEGAKCGAA